MHYFIGDLGHLFVITSLVTSLISAFAYWKANSVAVELKDQWLINARLAFYAHSAAVMGVVISLFVIIYQHYFEYHYAYSHSSLHLPAEYMVSCFWEGQEGSFLLWTLCHSILGAILIKRGGEWEAPVMSVLSFMQFALGTMVAGIYIFGWKMGSNPFILLRDSGIFDNAPGMHVNFDLSQPVRPDYMSTIKDGNDLNPLLQNYWMVIHPPVLFMGFASTTIPFAFAMAGLWKKKIGEWTKPALPWALFSAAVLGVGIMMGGQWA